MQHSRIKITRYTRCARLVAALLLYTAILAGCTHHRGSLSTTMPTVSAPDPDRRDWHSLHIASGMIGASAWSADHSFVAAEVYELPPGSSPDSEGTLSVIIEEAATGKVMHLPASVHSPFVWLPSGHTLVACNDSGESESPGLAWIGLDGTIARNVALPNDIANVQCIAALEADQEVAFIAQRETKDGTKSAVYTTAGAEIETIAESDEVDLDGIACVAGETGARLLWAQWDTDGPKVNVELYRFDLNSPDKDPAITKTISFDMLPPVSDQDADAEVNSVLFSPDGKSAAITAGLLSPGPNKDAAPVYLQGCYVVNSATGNCGVALTATAMDDDMNTLWSADSQALACSIAIGGVRSLYIWDKNGGLIKTVPYRGVKQ